MEDLTQGHEHRRIPLMFGSHGSAAEQAADLGLRRFLADEFCYTSTLTLPGGLRGQLHEDQGCECAGSSCETVDGNCDCTDTWGVCALRPDFFVIRRTWIL